MILFRIYQVFAKRIFLTISRENRVVNQHSGFGDIASIECSLETYKRVLHKISPSARFEVQGPTRSAALYLRLRSVDATASLIMQLAKSSWAILLAL